MSVLSKCVQEQSSDPPARTGPWSLDFKADHMTTDQKRPPQAEQMHRQDNATTTRPEVAF